MTSSILEEYIPAIEKQIEERKIITFKWISRKFGIHSTVAKQLLNDFAKDKSNDDKYSVTFAVFGKTEAGELAILLSEKDSNHFCDTEFTTIEKYVFSIEQTSFNVDSPVIYNEDKSAYQFDQINLSSINYPTKINRKTVTRTTSNPSPVKKKNVESIERSLNISEPIICENKAKEKIKGPNKIISLFTASKNKSDNKKDDTKNKCDKVDSKEKDLVLVNGTNDKLSDLSKTTAASTKVKDSDFTTMKKDVFAARNVCKTEANSNEKPLKKWKPKKKLPQKKLKRIVTPLDSSSDSENRDDDDSPFACDEEPECEPELPPKVKSSVPEPAAVITVRGKKRKRTVVEKTVTGKDGFLYTEKEVQYVSCESGDEENIRDENAIAATNKRAKVDDEGEVESADKIECKTLAENNAKSHKSKMKQASITNFFKKPS